MAQSALLKQWPATEIIMRPVADLTPYVNNSRTHSQQQIDQIAASINEWGFTNAVLIDEKGMIIAGHGRVLAAQKLKLKEVPTITARGWTEAQKKAYVIADNKLALNAGWDDDLLSLELKGLIDLNFDLSLTGFDGVPETVDFLPQDENSHGQIDELTPVMVTCPHCGEEFDAKNAV